ncbi:hypothetical protein ABIF55_001299 [Bradyrhizobium diazoefficiens]
MELQAARPLFKTIGFVFGLFCLLMAYASSVRLYEHVLGALSMPQHGISVVPRHRRECPPFSHELLRGDCGIAHRPKEVGRSYRKLALCPSCRLGRCILRDDGRYVGRRTNDLGSSCGQSFRPRRAMGRMECSQTAWIADHCPRLGRVPDPKTERDQSMTGHPERTSGCGPSRQLAQWHNMSEVGGRSEVA